jgi:uncharacterized protein YjbI with pentapeptide repeats
MAIATPAFALVRPRVRVTRTGEERLLEEVVAEIVDEYGSGFVRLCGGPGSGKSTALAHLAALFSHHENIQFLDEPTHQELESCSSDYITIAAMQSESGLNLELALLPWGIDELIEYLLAAHHDMCGAVIERLGKAANTRWVPEVACVVLDRLAENTSLHDVNDALLRHVYEPLSTAKQQLVVEHHCLTMLVGNISEMMAANSKLFKAGVPEAVRPLLRHAIVQLPLAARHIVKKIENGPAKELEQRLPFSLVELIGAQCVGRESVLAKLRKALASRWAETTHAMVASILLAADPRWCPEKPRRPWRFTGGVFCGAHWSEVNLFHAELQHSDFTKANLAGANLEGAKAEHAIFVDANLEGAAMVRLTANSANFSRAYLRRSSLVSASLMAADFRNAVLSEASLISADLSDADLSSAKLRNADLNQAKLLHANLAEADFAGANLRGAVLFGLDLRQATFTDACLEQAFMNEVQWEDACLINAKLKDARLSRAHLTGTKFCNADFRGADLRGAGLAEIDWEGADLSGADLRMATFHLGSSRSGLVGSYIACEGSKTGFYTDDLEDMTFKQPEEIRKANLRGADLRGVKADKVDFYLVDLRDAKLDPQLREQARSMGAILEDYDG